MAKGKHIIHKLVLQIEVPRRNTAQQVQDDAVRHFEHVILKQLELLLDEMDVPNHVLIDKIDLDLGSGNLEAVFEQLTASLAKTLDPVLNPSILPDTKKEDAEIRHQALTEEQKAFDVFVHFITTGRLPWYAAADTDWLRQEELWFSKLLPVLTKDGVSRSKLIGVFKTSKVTVSRLFKQFSIASVKKLLVVLLTIEEQQLQKAVKLIVQQVQLKNEGKGKEGGAKTYTQLPEDIEISISDNKKSAVNEPDLDRGTLLAMIEKMLFALYVRKGEFSIILEEVAKKIAILLVESFRISTQPSTSKLIEIAAAVLKQQEQQPIAQKNKPTATPDKLPETNSIQKEDEGGVYISQAGLVILHPFLEYFFKDFGLLQDNDFVDLPARQLAVHLLHYLGTGNINAFEYDLYFEKFLCRWPADEPLERDVEIPQRMLDEAGNMLLTVIKYWKALKNTSPGGLREGFLNRNGKLIEAEQPVRLIVERMDMDILLSTLPWGMGVIKLPWMVGPFYVEWQ